MAISIFLVTAVTLCIGVSALFGWLWTQPSVSLTDQFSDATFRQCVADALGTSPDSRVSRHDLSRLDHLRCRDQDGARITSISGIERLTGLKALDMKTSEPLVDISPLASVRSLREVTLHGTEDLRPLETLPHLERLQLVGTSGGRTYKPQLGSLRSMTSLREFVLIASGISDLSPVGQARSLTSLHLASTPVNDLSPLEKLTRLESVTLSPSDGPIPDLSPLAALPSLTEVSLLAGNATGQIDIGALAGSRSITSLSVALSFGQPPDALVGALSLGDLATLQELTLGLLPEETDLSWVGSLANLRSFMLINSDITDISPLGGLPHLSSVTLLSVPVESVAPLTRCPELKTVHLEDTGKVGDLDSLEKLPGVTVTQR